MTTAWQDSAACRGMDSELFFPRQGGDVRLPKSICADCPVIDPCLEHALRHEPRGVWGGTTDRGRRIIRQARGIHMLRPEAVVLVGALCGTPAAYKRHLREGTPICDLCRRDHNEREVDRRVRTRQAS